MKKFALILLALLPSSLAASELPTSGPATKPAKLTGNAAIAYREAFAALPAMTAAQRQAASNCASAPLGEEVRRLIAAGKPALKLLRQGAACKSCNWRTDKQVQESFDDLISRLSQASQLAQLAILRARAFLADKKPAEAIDDIAAVLALGRHLSPQSPLISHLAGLSMADIAIETAAANLPMLCPADLKALAARIEALPSQPTLTEVFDQEKKFIEKTQPDSALRDLMIQLYEQLASIAEFPPKEFDDALKALNNPAYGAIGQSLAGAAYRHAVARAKLEMLQAAIAVLLDGKEKLSSVKDPFGSGAFQYKAINKGFTLQSALKVAGRNITLTIGSE